MSIAYFDCASGVAGDMVLGSLIDAGLPLKRLERGLSKVIPGMFRLRANKRRSPVAGIDLKVEAVRELAHAHYTDIDRMIARSALEKGARELARAIFGTLGRAEARVHGVALKNVHFHEVGSIDSVADIVGSAIGFEHFKFKSVHASPLPMTRGRVKFSHGAVAVPPPAVLEILKGAPFERSKIRGEIVTPTGAAILKTVAEGFGECPIQRVSRVAHGYGDKELPGVVNALRLVIGEGFPAVAIEADIDDMNPQLFAPVVEGLFRLGAADASLIPLQMKKGRPAVRIFAIAPWDKKDAVMDFLLRETTTFGVRYWPVERKMLTRELIVQEVRKGNVAFKAGYDSEGRLVKMVPEFDDVVRLARKEGRPVLEVCDKLRGLNPKPRRLPPSPRRSAR